MSGRPALQRSALLAFAVGGVLLGHALTYGLLLPDVHARSAALTQTGHGYLAIVERVGLVGVLVVLGTTFLGRLVRAGGPVPDLRTLLARLAAFQLSAFTAMEIAERLGAGAGLHDLPTVLATGLVVQLSVAMTAGAIVHLTLRLADTVAAAIAAPRPPLPRAALVTLAPAAALRPHPARRLLPDGRGPPRR